MTVTAVVGGQFGSEGKGAVVGHMASGASVHVRVGAANAGHTLYVDGEKHVLQQLPCAAYANPWAKLVLGAGAMISLDVLNREIEENIRWRKDRGLPNLKLYVDHRAHVVTEEHVRQEQATDLAERIGSTSATAREGIGAAQAARVMRVGYRQVKGTDLQYGLLQDTVRDLHDAVALDTHILLEGTQGAGLSNTTGFYPYVTSRNTTASGLAADCGFGPADIDHVIVVLRTFPIRVAGNSGPFWPDSAEKHWEDMGINPDTERTTVTKKVRRVATFSYDQAKQAARLNSASEFALMFADYLAPELRGERGLHTADDLAEVDYVGPMISHLERITGVPVTMVGTGPQTIIDRQPSQQLTWRDHLNKA